MTAFCLLLGAVATWYRIAERDYRQQLELANRFQQQGAVVGWGPFTTPKWLCWIGNSADFQRIIGVSTWQPETISDDDISWLSSLDQVSIAVPADKLLDDSLIERIARIKSLKDLMILPFGDEQKSRNGIRNEIAEKLPGVNVVTGQIHKGGE
jgi:hypothetical protein